MGYAMHIVLWAIFAIVLHFLNATLEEISLTITPANPAARVLHWHRHSSVVEAYDLANAGVSKCGDRQGSDGDEPWAAAFTGKRASDRRAVSRPRMTAVFRQLVEELDHEH